MRIVLRNFIYALIAIPLLITLASPAVHAQKAKKEDEEKKSGPTVDEKTGKRLNEAIEFINNDQYDAARAALAELKLDTLSPYERSRVEQIFATIDQAQEKYDGARTHFQAAIAAGGLNEQELKDVQYVICQLYIIEEKWKDGITCLEKWFTVVTKPNSAAYYMLAVSYYQIEDYKRALAPAIKAVELAEKPQEGWLQLVVALYMQLDQYADAIPVLERLVAMSPEKKNYWLQLSSIYGEKEDYANALTMMEIPYNGGLLTEDAEYRRLSDLLTMEGIPYRAAQVLLKGLEAKKVKEDQKLLEKLANCWIAAREFDKAVTPLQKAAQMAGSGDLFMRLGEVNTQRENWEEAARAFRSAIDKGSLRDVGNAHLMLGISLYNQKKNKEALEWFRRASNSAKHKKTADGFMQLINNHS
jgi:tetratricopeptide (TPR) repeat protein